MSGKRNSKCGREPIEFYRKPRFLKVVDHLGEVRPQEVGEHEAVVQRRAPADQLAAVGAVPEHGDEGAHQQLLHRAHTRMRRHLE